VGTFFRDVSYGARTLRKKPGFAAAAVAVLALGIGANTAVFSLVNAFLLKPLAVHQPERLAGCFNRHVRKPEFRGFSYVEYAALRDHTAAFSSLMAHNLSMVGVTEGVITRRAFAAIVSANYFETFGAPLMGGRAFSAAEERPGAGIPVVIVSHSYWKKTGADPQLPGKLLRINGRLHTVIGIAPEGFTGTTALFGPEVYLPLGMFEAAMNDFDGHGHPLADPTNHALLLVGRLRPGVSWKSADALLAPAAARLAEAFPAEDKDRTLVARPLSRMSVSTSPSDDSGLAIPAALLFSVAAVVLLIASLNVANMMLARGTARGREIAIRLAVGGSRTDILRQLLLEGFLLALAGGACGLAVAYWSTGVLVRSIARLAPLDMVYSAVPDLRVLLATMAFCTLSTLLFGLGPAWGLSRRSLLVGLKSGDRGDGGGRPRRSVFARGNLLVMGQVALSLMLLSAAGLFVRSSLRVARVETGFRVAGQAVAEVDASLAGYNEARGREVYRAVLDRLRAAPGVESASIAATIPFGMVSIGRSLQRPAGGRGELECRYNIVGSEYFRTMGIPVLRGRAFGPQDADRGAPAVAILDREAAEELWPGGDAVGRHVRMLPAGSEPARAIEIVGVVAPIRESVMGRRAEPHLYAPFGQAYQSNAHFHVRSAGAGTDAEARLVETVRREIAAVDSHLPVLALRSMATHMDSSFDLWLVRTGATMFVIFGAVALLLAAIGLYGVRAYSVGMRTREIGIRMALGAEAADALGMVLREGLMLMAIGGAVGLALSLGVGKVLSGLLYGVPSVDPVVLSISPAVLGAVSLVACWVPARRAARIDPMMALRDE
jgi:predicted permease